MRPVPNVVSQQNRFIEDFATSPLAFYDLVRAGIERRGLPNLTFSHVEWQESGAFSAKRTYLRVNRGALNFDFCAAPYGNGFFFSYWLATIPPGAIVFLYLAVILGILVFPTFCLVKGGAGYGAFILGPLMSFAALALMGYHARTGQVVSEEVVLHTPVVGRLYRLIFTPTTYFALDTEAMFRESVALAWSEAIEEVTKPKGIRAAPLQAAAGGD